MTDRTEPPPERSIVHATEVADRVHRLAHAHVNCYLIDDDDGVTLVDAGLPSMWALMTETLRRLERGPVDVWALVLTHGNFDHVGFARRARVELEVPVPVHPADGHLAAYPYQLHATAQPPPVPLHTSTVAARARSDGHGRRSHHQGDRGHRGASGGSRSRRPGPSRGDVRPRPPRRALHPAPIRPGHGEPWTDGVDAAVGHARAVGEH